MRAEAAQATLPTVLVTAAEASETASVAPLAGGDAPIAEVPAATHVHPAREFTPDRAANVAEALARVAPSVSLLDVTGNPYQPQLDYRGFAASPVLGTPQGVALYQNGVRINEVFGDTVNWDFIPDRAIRRATVVPNNPVFGLNATGGAIALDTKTGFDHQGSEVEVRGGSFGRRAISGESGTQKDGQSAYVAGDVLNDDGWRARDSWSKLRRLYVDLGARNDRAEVHMTFTGAANSFGNVGPTPIELLQRDWRSVYTTPQATDNRLAFWTANARYALTDTLSVQANTYLRGFWQNHIDGNISDDAEANPPGSVPGRVDRIGTSALGWGGTVQATDTRIVFGFANRLIAGASFDGGQARFSAASELGVIDANLIVRGTGEPAPDVPPVRVLAHTAYSGLYLHDTLKLSERLALTVGGRFNVAHIRLQDELGDALNGEHRYTRFNPMAGATYSLAPWLSAYAGYSEANRAPTPVELACADPARPCLLDNFLVADPELKQVVSHTIEAGLRGKVDGAGAKLTWSAGLFRTESDDDIINVASTVSGRGYFQNAGTTLRQGVEASARLVVDRWQLQASVSFVDATFRTALTLPSPNNPAAVNGLIHVAPGDVIPGVPDYRAKLAADYRVTEAWTVGAGLIGIGSQYFIGDASNQNPKLPAYSVVNLRTSYRVSPQVELFSRVQNLFDRRYATYGTFFDPNGIPFLGLSDPRSVSPAMPLGIYAGLRAKL